MVLLSYGELKVAYDVFNNDYVLVTFNMIVRCVRREMGYKGISIGKWW